MTYKRDPGKLAKLIEDVLADSTIRRFAEEAGLSLRHVRKLILDQQEEAWNAAGTEIEDYNKADAALATARSALEADLTALAETEKKRRLLLPSPASPNAGDRNFGLFFATSWLGIGLLIVYFFFWSPSLGWLLTMRLPDLSQVLTPLAITSFVSFALLTTVLFRGSALYARKVRKLTDGYNLFALQSSVLEKASVVDRAVSNRGLLPIARSAISNCLKDSYETNLPLMEVSGLGEVHEAHFEVETIAQRRLLSMLQTMEGGSIGIAGPRGAGKTTLMRMFCDERALELRGRPVLAVMTPAPAQYDAREFILHLFFVVCRRLCYLNGVNVDQIIWSRERDRVWVPRIIVDFLVRANTPLRVSGISLVALAFLIGFAALSTNFIRLSGSLPGSARQSVMPPVAEPAPTPPVQTTEPKTGLTTPKPADAPKPIEAPSAAPKSAPPHPPSGLAETGPHPPSSKAANPWEHVLNTLTALGLSPANLIFWGILLLALSFAPDILARLAQERAEGDAIVKGDRLDYREALERSPTPLVTDALRWLHTIKFQQSYTSGWSGTLKFPIGLDGSIKDDSTFVERPLSFPEIVSRLTAFLGQLGREYWVLIGIDELDKIHPAESAERFLNDIKVIFGVNRVFYLLSVSENVLSSFERRGIPVRNAFDSCFDEMVPVYYLNLSGAVQLIRRRILGMPKPFACLCYCLSGGLPRDLIRVCRTLLLESARSPTQGIGDLCDALLRAELSAKLYATETLATEATGGPQLTSFLDSLRSVNLEKIDANGELVDLWNSQPLIALDDDGETAVGKPALNDLRSDIAAYLSYAILIYSFFARNEIDEKEFIKAEEQGTFEAVAKLRQSLSVNRGLANLLAKRLTEVIRNGNSITPGGPFQVS